MLGDFPRSIKFNFKRLFFLLSSSFLQDLRRYNDDDESGQRVDTQPSTGVAAAVVQGEETSPDNLEIPVAPGQATSLGSTEMEGGEPTPLVSDFNFHRGESTRRAASSISPTPSKRRKSCEKNAIQSPLSYHFFRITSPFHTHRTEHRIYFSISSARWKSARRTRIFFFVVLRSSWTKALVSWRHVGGYLVSRLTAFPEPRKIHTYCVSDSVRQERAWRLTLDG